MKPFGKWLADFELPQKAEPEPEIEVVIHQGGLIAPSVDDLFNAPCGISMAHPVRRLYQIECKADFNAAALRESLDQIEMAIRNRRMRIEKEQRHG